MNTKIKELQRECLVKKGEEIGINEISKRLKVSTEEVAMALDSQIPIESIDEKYYENDNSMAWISKISNGINEEEMLVNRLCLDGLINELDQREKQIILLRYYRGKTQSEIANLLGVTQVQISRIEKKILNNMKERIEL